ncbi:MAG TPA: DUF2145 domain-containing protein [Ramlibacter sp.]|nr:DUF2145 domain-containing protein [Ramlibacter sp.]
MRRISALLAAMVAAVILAAVPAHAGRSCEAVPPKAAAIERGLRLAQRTHEALEAAHARDGTQAVVLARAGQDLTKYGLRYSHLGLAWRTRDAQGRAAWHVLHKLNACGTAEAAIYRQGLGEFFLDDLWRYEAAWAVPRRDVQDRLVALLADDARAVRLHHRPYSIVSYGWGRKYQQSNQWAVETLAAALDPSVDSRERAQDWLQRNGYQPSVLRLGPLTRLGGRLSAANVAFDDHPVDKRYADRIETVTVDSVFAWMERSGLGTAPVRLQ